MSSYDVAQEYREEPDLVTSRQALDLYKRKDATKVVVLFKAVGNAPVMLRNDFNISASNPFQAIVVFLRKHIGWRVQDPLFTYINQSFAPAPDDNVGNLYRAFSTNGRLIVNYSTLAAWG
ncbi:autophagy protein 12 [Peniophora sp. CONT]|nr:autophagy protein 12 [Peniophora sp. CONT]